MPAGPTAFVPRAIDGRVVAAAAGSWGGALAYAGLGHRSPGEHGWVLLAYALPLALSPFSLGRRAFGLALAARVVWWFHVTLGLALISSHGRERALGLWIALGSGLALVAAGRRGFERWERAHTAPFAPLVLIASIMLAPDVHLLLLASVDKLDREPLVAGVLALAGCLVALLSILLLSRPKADVLGASLAANVALLVSLVTGWVEPHVGIHSLLAATAGARSVLLLLPLWASLDPHWLRRLERLRPNSNRPERGLGLLGVSLAVVLAVALSVFGGPAIAVLYSTEVDAVLERPTLWSSRRELRVSGILAQGSLVRFSPCDLELGLRSRRATERELLVRSSSCSTPEALHVGSRYPVELVVQGRLHTGDAGVYLAAESIFVRSTHYELHERDGSP